MVLTLTTYEHLCSLFCLYAQTPEGEKAAEMAIREPWKFVLKPQKEGGGVCRCGGMCSDVERRK